jgi:hypothetical protein
VTPGHVAIKTISTCHLEDRQTCTIMCQYEYAIHNPSSTKENRHQKWSTTSTTSTTSTFSNLQSTISPFQFWAARLMWAGGCKFLGIYSYILHPTFYIQAILYYLSWVTGYYPHARRNTERQTLAHFLVVLSSPLLLTLAHFGLLEDYSGTTF